MTLGEAVIQAWAELGMNRETVELRAKFTEAFLPDTAALRESPVKPGYEQQFIEELKIIFREMEDDFESIQAVVRSQMEERAKLN